MSNEVIIRDAVKSYGDFSALSGVSLNLREGDFFPLLGPSGCGKTTLLRMIAGFNSIEGGDFYFGDKRINDVPAHKRDIGMVFQNYAIFPHLTVSENVAYGLKARKVEKAEISRRVAEALELVQISHLADRKPNELSGGPQQRVALARAFVIEPSVLLMDDPLSNLDAKLRVSMRTEIRRIQQEAGITAIYVTHDQSEAMALSDQIIIMEKGVVSQIATPQEIYYHPANEFVADFIGEANFLRGTLSQKQGDKGVVVVEGTSVDVTGVYGIQQGNGCTLVLRPESAVLSDRGQLPCKVIVSCFMGAYQNYHVMVGNTLVKITDFNPKNKKIYRVGDTAYVAFEKENIHVL